MLKKLKQEGITILVSTPYMDEANLCDRIALVQKGDILSIDKPAAIVSSFPGELYAVRASNTHRLLQDVRSYPGTATCFAFGDALHVTFSSESKDLMDYLHSKGHMDASIMKIDPTIEDCFIHLLK
jgi:ABC-type multidrug transport system ATPase subunit